MKLEEHAVLYVDDENANLVVMKHNLASEFPLLLARSGPEALEILAREKVAVLLADQRMPGMTGVDLAAQVLELYPDVIRVIITAYSDLEATIDAINRAQVNRFIKKPWSHDELVAVLRESVSTYDNVRLIRLLQDRLAQLDRITSLAILASGISHDLRQPLSYIEPTVSSLRDTLAAVLAQSLGQPLRGELEFIADGLKDVQSGIHTFKVIANTLLKSLRIPEESHVSIDLTGVIEASVRLVQGLIVRCACFDLDVPKEPIVLEGSEGRLIQLLVNLLLNAVQAIPAGEPWRHAIRLSLRVEGEWVVLDVEDTGVGIAPENLERIFTPFFTTKGSSGSGLGLPICKQVAEEHGGSLQVAMVGGRTRFEVRLPLDRAQTGPATDAPPGEWRDQSS